MCFLFFITYLKWFLLKSVANGTGMPMPDWGSWLPEEMPMLDLIFSGIPAFHNYFSRSYSKNIHHQQPSIEWRVYHFSLPAVTMLIPFHNHQHQYYRRAEFITVHCTCCLDVQGVSLSPTPAVWTCRLYPFPPPAVWTCKVYPFHHHQHMQYGRTGCLPFQCQQYGHAGCIPVHRQQYGRAGCIPFHPQQYGRTRCIHL